MELILPRLYWNYDMRFTYNIMCIMCNSKGVPPHGIMHRCHEQTNTHGYVVKIKPVLPEGYEVLHTDSHR